MPHETPLSILEEEERRARIRLASFRVRLFRPDGMSPMTAEARLRELQRRWKGAADRLSKAKHRAGHGAR